MCLLSSSLRLDLELVSLDSEAIDRIVTSPGIELRVNMLAGERSDESLNVDYSEIARLAVELSEKLKAFDEKLRIG